MRRLSCCKPEWFALGSALGIPNEELRKFENEKMSPGVDRCLHDTLRIWIESGDTDKATLVTAVQACGEEELSRIIELKYTDRR